MVTDALLVGGAELVAVDDFAAGAARAALQKHLGQSYKEVRVIEGFAKCMCWPDKQSRLDQAWIWTA